MSRDKTITRILLIFFVANVALAAPVLVRQRHLGVAEVVLEKRDPGSNNEATDGSSSDLMPELVSDSDESHHLSHSGSTDSRLDAYFLVRKSLDDSPPDSPSGSSHGSNQDWPTTPTFHEIEGGHLYYVPPLAWDRIDRVSVSSDGSAPESPTGSSHYDSAPGSLSSGTLHYDSAGESHYDSASESSVGSMPELVSDSEKSMDSAESASLDDQLSHSSSGSSHGDWPPTSPAGSFHEGAYEGYYRPSVLRFRPLLRPPQVLELSEGSAPASPSRSSHHDSSPESSAGSMPELVSDSEESVNSPEPLAESDPSLHLTTPASGSTSSHHDSAPVSADRPVHDNSVAPVPADPSMHDYSEPVLAAPPSHDNSVAVAVAAAPSTHDGPAPAAAAPSANDDLTPLSGHPPSHGNPPSTSGTSQLHDDPPSTSGTSQLHDASPPTAGTSQLHDDLPSTSGASQLLDDLPPEVDRLFNGELIHKIRDYAVSGTVASTSTSGDVIRVGRGGGTHLRPQENLCNVVLVI